MLKTALTSFDYIFQYSLVKPSTPWQRESALTGPGSFLYSAR